jgi:pentose-5-phosphate-3-epimerase
VGDERDSGPGNLGLPRKCTTRLRAELVRRGLEHVDIEVDDGGGPDNIRVLADAGITIAVAGTSVVDPRAPVAANVRLLRAAGGLREST